MNFNWIKNKREKASKVIAVIMVLAIGIFPFTHNKAAINIKKDLDITPEQQLAKQVCVKASSIHSTNALYLISNPIF